MTPEPQAPPSLYVLAGPNGAGKSSLFGALIRERGADYFNPDEAAARILPAKPGIAPREANSLAWRMGKRLLERAITSRYELAIETTLGGTTIPALLAKAHDAGMAVRVWYAGLQGAELHIERVRARVAAGGHDIPASHIRERYDRSRENLIRLLPRLTELRMFDNSREGDPRRGEPPRPRLILHFRDGAIVESCDFTDVPQWAKPVFMAALRHDPP